MVEEYLDGCEVDCDMIMAEGEVVYGAVTDNWPTIEPWFNETGSNCPSTLTDKQQMELLELSANSLKARMGSADLILWSCITASFGSIPLILLVRQPASPSMGSRWLRPASFVLVICRKGFLEWLRLSSRFFCLRFLQAVIKGRLSSRPPNASSSACHCLTRRPWA